MNLPSIETLHCFVVASRLLNFRSAAKKVALTPAAFGQRIRQLEDQLDVVLFHRTTRSVSLTSAGLALLPRAERCIETALDCTKAARGEIGPPAMDIVLGTRYELGLSWIVPQIDHIKHIFPNIGLHLYFGSGSDLLLRVRTMEIDCAIASTRFTDPKLDSIRLHREDYVFVGSTKLLKENKFTTTHDACRHTLLDHGPELPLFRYWRDAPGGGDRLQFQNIVKMGSIEAIRRRVLAGAGVAVLPQYLVREDLKKKIFTIVFPKVSPLHDYFRFIFRADDPKRSVFENIAHEMIRTPLK